MQHVDAIDTLTSITVLTQLCFQPISHPSSSRLSIIKLFKAIITRICGLPQEQKNDAIASNYLGILSMALPNETQSKGILCIKVAIESIKLSDNSKLKWEKFWK